MEKTLTIINEDQKIKISDLDGENEIRIEVIDMDAERALIWLTPENIISLKKHLDYIISKF